MISELPTVQRFLGFYLSRPFWAESIVDIDELETKGSDVFTSTLQQEIFSFETCNFTIKICRDGMFLLRLKELAARVEINYEKPKDFSLYLTEWSEYLVSANAIALLFESFFLEIQKYSYFETKELTNKDAFGVRFENGKWAGNSINTLSIAEKFQNARFLHYRAAGGTPLSFDSKYSGRAIVSQAVFDKLTTSWVSISTNQRLIGILDQLNKSIGEYKVGNFDTALVLTWFIAESIIQDLWSAWLDSKNQKINSKMRINSERRNTLEGRDYTMSAKIHQLELNDKLPFEIFEELNRVRTFRNKIVHQDKKYRCSMEDGAAAINATSKLLKFYSGIDLNLNLSISIAGL